MSPKSCEERIWYIDMSQLGHNILDCLFSDSWAVVDLCVQQHLLKERSSSGEGWEKYWSIGITKVTRSRLNTMSFKQSNNNRLPSVQGLLPLWLQVQCFLTFISQYKVWDSCIFGLYLVRRLIYKVNICVVDLSNIKIAEWILAWN